MSRSVLQIPINRELRLSAEEVALAEGFSSLQEFVRVLLNKVANRELSIQISSVPTIDLTNKANDRYEKILKDYKKGENIYSAESVDDLISKLNEAN